MIRTTTNRNTRRTRPTKRHHRMRRVWRTYEDESRIHDANMVEESRDNVDVLLVFVSPFVALLYFVTEPRPRRVFSSAVVTTFVAQTSQSLQPDYAAMSASLLYESVLVQTCHRQWFLSRLYLPLPPSILVSLLFPLPRMFG